MSTQSANTVAVSAVYAKRVGVQIVDVIRYVLHVESFLALGVIALCLGVIEGLAVLPNSPTTLVAATARALWASYFYLVLRRAASGSRRLPHWEDYRDTWDTLIHPLMQASVIGVWYWAPLLWCTSQTMGLNAFAQQLQLRSIDFFREPSVLAPTLLCAILVYLPAALSASATTRSILRLFDPSWGVRIVLRAPWAYCITFSSLLVFTVAAFISTSFSSLVLQSLPIPLAAPVLGHLLTLWVPLAQARLLGDFVFQNRGTLQPPQNRGTLQPPSHQKAN